MIIAGLILGLLLVIGLIFLLVRFARTNLEEGHTIAWPFWTSLWGFILTVPFVPFALGAHKFSELSTREWESQLWEAISVTGFIPFAFHCLVVANILQFLWIFLLAKEGLSRILKGAVT